MCASGSSCFHALRGDVDLPSSTRVTGSAFVSIHEQIEFQFEIERATSRTPRREPSNGDCETPRKSAIDTNAVRSLNLRRPVGWPCEIVYQPPVSDCPVLRAQVEFVFNLQAFQAYVARFQHGPFRLEHKKADRLMCLFKEHPQLS